MGSDINLNIPRFVDGNDSIGKVIEIKEENIPKIPLSSTKESYASVDDLEPHERPAGSQAGSGQVVPVVDPEVKQRLGINKQLIKLNRDGRLLYGKKTNLLTQRAIDENRAEVTTVDGTVIRGLGGRQATKAEYSSFLDMLGIFNRAVQKNKNQQSNGDRTYEEAHGLSLKPVEGHVRVHKLKNGREKDKELSASRSFSASETKMARLFAENALIIDFKKAEQQDKSRRKEDADRASDKARVRTHEELGIDPSATTGSMLNFTADENSVKQRAEEEADGHPRRPEVH